MFKYGNAYNIGIKYLRKEIKDKNRTTEDEEFVSSHIHDFYYGLTVQKELYYFFVRKGIIEDNPNELY